MNLFVANLLHRNTVRDIKSVFPKLKYGIKLREIAQLIFSVAEFSVFNLCLIHAIHRNKCHIINQFLFWILCRARDIDAALEKEAVAKLNIKLHCNLTAFSKLMSSLLWWFYRPFIKLVYFWINLNKSSITFHILLLYSFFAPRNLAKFFVSKHWLLLTVYF